MGLFRSVGTLKVLFSCLRPHQPLYPRCFPAFLFRRRCLDCQIRRVACSGTVAAQSPWQRCVSAAALQELCCPVLSLDGCRFDGCDATLCCVWCGSTLAGSCTHVRFQPLWVFAALLCGDAFTATERVIECHRVGSAGWVLSSLPWRGAMKMYLRVGTILEVDCWIDAPVLLS